MFSAKDLFKPIKRKIQHFDVEAVERTADASANRFDRRKYTALVVVFVVLAIVEVFQLVTPPEDIAKIFERSSTEFELIKNGYIYFSRSESPPHIPKDDKFAIKLPARDVTSLANFDAHGTWYEFRVLVPEKFRNSNGLGLLIPKIWGDSKIYVDDTLVDFGRDIRLILAIVSPDFRLKIRVNSTSNAIKAPITATYPLVIGDIGTLRSLSKSVDDQYQTSYRAMAVYGLAIMLFGMLFVAYPKKPELLAFIFFLIFSFSNVFIQTFQDTNRLLFWKNLSPIYVGIPSDLLTNLSLLCFSLFFFRAHPKKVWGALINGTLFAIFIGIPASYFFFTALSVANFRPVAHSVLNCIFLTLQIWYLTPRTIHLFSTKEVPNARKIAAGIVASTILSLYAVNILDYFNLISTVTTLPRNNLLLHITLAIVVAYEVSRAEMNQLIFGSMLPKEVKEGVHLNKTSVNEKGFVILVDALDYSSNRARFDDSDLRASYIDKLAQSMLKPLSELGISNFSILNCTGDGIYCAVRGEPNRENFLKSFEFVTAINSLVLTSANEKQIKFRSAIGYGHYGVKIIEVGKLRKDFVAGNILNDLSRIIGSKPGETSVRVLFSEHVHALFPYAETCEIIDKHGFSHRYFELREIEKAA